MSGKTLISLCLLAGVAGSYAGIARAPYGVVDVHVNYEPGLRAKRETPGQPKVTYSKETIAKAGEEVMLDCAVEGVDLKGVEGFGVSWAKIDLDKPTNSYPISAGGKILLFSSKYRIEHPADSYKYSLVVKGCSADHRCASDFRDNLKIKTEKIKLVDKTGKFSTN
ncbi:unnamed protein product, partial [Meganyctiphanes norvegica]